MFHFLFLLFAWHSYQLNHVSANILTDKYGQCGENLTWNYDELSHTLTITGYGAMFNYTNEFDIPWNNYSKSIEYLELAEEMTSISDFSFFELKKLKTVFIPDLITSIGSKSFAFCSNFSEITLGSSLSHIAPYAFYHCFSLISINVSESNTHYQSRDGVLYSFSGAELIIFPCSHPNKIFRVPESVTTIHNNAFQYCSKLEHVIFSSPVTICQNAFSFCKELVEITNSNFIVSVDSFAFYSTSITAFDFGENLSFIGDSAFSYCHNLLQIGNRQVSHNYPISIGSRAFFSCLNLGDVYISEKIQSIGYEAFGDCFALKTFDFSPQNSIQIIDNFTFSHCARIESISLPSTVTTIGQYSFYQCAGLASITIPTNVISILEGAFHSCTNLKALTFAGDNLETIANLSFFNCSSLTSVELPRSVTHIGIDAFSECSMLESYSISNSNYETIDGVLFNQNKTFLISYPPMKKGSNYIMPLSVSHISRHAFFSANLITNIDLISNLTFISAESFYLCSNLTSLTYFGIESPEYEFDIIKDCHDFQTVYVYSNYTGKDFCQHNIEIIDKPDDNHKRKVRFIITISCAAAILAIIIILVIVYFIKNKHKTQSTIQATLLDSKMIETAE